MGHSFILLATGKIFIETYIRHGRQHLSKSLTLGPEQNLFQDSAVFRLRALPMACSAFFKRLYYLFIEVAYNEIGHLSKSSWDLSDCNAIVLCIILQCINIPTKIFLPPLKPRPPPPIPEIKRDECAHTPSP